MTLACNPEICVRQWFKPCHCSSMPMRQTEVLTKSDHKHFHLSQFIFDYRELEIIWVATETKR